MFCAFLLTKWKDWLALAKFWYNTTYHSSLQQTPFKVLYGQKHRHLSIDVVEACVVPGLKKWLAQRKLMTQLLQQQLIRVQQKQKHQADKNRSERTFDVGDMVFLKIQPLFNPHCTGEPTTSCHSFFFGPYQILEKIGAVAYRLELPPSASIHPVFHVSLLKRAVSPCHQVSPEPHVLTDAFQIPLKILERRLVENGHKTVAQVLIQWSKWPPYLSTWEEEVVPRQRFPEAPAWRQAVSKERGDVMN